MSLFSPIKELSRGLATYVRGVRWLRDHPKHLALLLIPGLVGLVFLIGAVVAFAHYDERMMAWLLFARPTEADPWYWSLLYVVSKVLLYFACLVLTFLSAFLVMNVVASPVYDAISTAVERDVTGKDPPSLGFRGHLRVMLAELKKVAFILIVSIILLLIPGFNVISSVVAAFLVGWDFFDYPLARRGWSFGRRLRFVAREFWSVLGFGLWLMIPFAQIIMLPLAVAGGTLLNLEALERRRLLNP